MSNILNKLVITLSWLKSQMNDSNSELYLLNEDVSSFKDLNRGITAKEIKNSTFVTYSADSSKYGLHLRNYEGGNTPYSDNQYVIREDLSATNKVINYKNSTLTAGDMDPMGGVSKLIFNILSNTDSEKVDLTQEDNFKIYGQYLRVGSETAELLNIQGVNTIVFNNNLNTTSNNKSKTITLAIDSSAISTSVRQNPDDLGVFTKGRGTITDGKLNSKLCSNLIDANWKSGGTHLTFGGGIKNVPEANGGDWYITDDVLYERGTVLNRNKVSDSLTTTQGFTLSSIYSGKYHISWDKANASDYEIFMSDEVSMGIECPDRYTGSREKSYLVTYICNYRLVSHNYGKTAILYAESYPEKFLNTGVPYIREFTTEDFVCDNGFKLNQDSKPDKKYFSNTQYTNPTLVHLSVGTSMSTSANNFSVTSAKGATASLYPNFALNTGEDLNTWKAAIFWLDPENCYREDGIIYLKASDEKTYTDDENTNIHYMRELHTTTSEEYARYDQSIYGDLGNDTNTTCGTISWPTVYVNLPVYYTPLYTVRNINLMVLDTYGPDKLSNEYTAKSRSELATECGEDITAGSVTVKKYKYCKIGDTFCGSTVWSAGWYKASTSSSGTEFVVTPVAGSDSISISGYASIVGSSVKLSFTSDSIPTVTSDDSSVTISDTTTSSTTITATKDCSQPPVVKITITCNEDLIYDTIYNLNSTGLSYSTLCTVIPDIIKAK